ncbi:MAG: hypothetical protein FOGNACKC_00865 [Anaerolineae bacterium]|nr:hypothetical protein [Anaerolineae bacterium]
MNRFALPGYFFPVRPLHVEAGLFGPRLGTVGPFADKATLDAVREAVDVEANKIAAYKAAGQGQTYDQLLALKLEQQRVWVPGGRAGFVVGFTADATTIQFVDGQREFKQSELGPMLVQETAVVARLNRDDLLKAGMAQAEADDLPAEEFADIVQQVREKLGAAVKAALVEAVAEWQAWK